MRWLDSLTDAMDMNLSKLWEIVEDRGTWHAAVHRVTKSQTWLSDWTTTTLFVLLKHYSFPWETGYDSIWTSTPLSKAEAFWIPNRPWSHLRKVLLPRLVSWYHLFTPSIKVLFLKRSILWQSPKIVSDQISH